MIETHMLIIKQFVYCGLSRKNYISAEEILVITCRIEKIGRQVIRFFSKLKCRQLL